MVKYIQNYALYESIGSGVYGKVYRAVNNNDKKEYAVKVIPIAKFRENKKLQECTVNEINILTNIEANQHIIRYYDMLKTSNNFYFIYEFCNGGTLEGLLSRQGKLSQQSALLIFKQLLEAFQVLNKYNIMHRDLKPDNIFFNNGIIKLGDFGFCKNLNSADQMAKTMLGSPIYMAPEVLKGQIYSNKADIWSLGVVLYEMIFGHCPFQSNSIARLIEVLNTKQLDFPDKISNFLKELIQKMLTKDPSKRIGWMQLFQIKISNEGYIQNQKIKAISSLSDAKFSDQLATLNPNKYTQKMTTSVKQGNQQQNITGSTSPMITNTTSNTGNMSQQTVNINQPSSNVSSMSQTTPNSHGQSPQHQFLPSQMNNTMEGSFKKNRTQGQGSTMNSNNLINTNSQVQQTINTNGNYSLNNNNQIPISQQPVLNTPVNIASVNSNSNFSLSQGNKISEEHKIILQGVKLAMEIIDSRIPNYSGYANLILTKNVLNLQNLLQRPFRKQIIEILQKELKDMKNDRDFITSKMFSYELKGLDDWKKYMRGKFFQDEKTITLWFKMITFLNGSHPFSNTLSSSQMAQTVKSILY